MAVEKSWGAVWSGQWSKRGGGVIKCSGEI